MQTSSHNRHNDGHPGCHIKRRRLCHRKVDLTTATPKAVGHRADLVVGKVDGP